VTAPDPHTIKKIMTALADDPERPGTGRLAGRKETRAAIADFC